MSAATALAFETPRRIFQRHPIHVPVDFIALRSGVPETLPGRCTDISEAGIGAVVAGELLPGQQIALELRLPDVGVPVRVRAIVSHHSRLRCGVEFIGLSTAQREMIRYWLYRSAARPVDFRPFQIQEKTEVSQEQVAGGKAPALAVVDAQAPSKPGRKIRIARRALYVLLACMLGLAALGWWQWQKSWAELEAWATPVAEPGLRVSPGTMEERIVAKPSPVYPEAARTTGTEGLVVLDALIGEDGMVKKLSTLSGPSVLAQSAMEAVRSWKFDPYIASGRAVAVETTIAVDFRLN